MSDTNSEASQSPLPLGSHVDAGRQMDARRRKMVEEQLSGRGICDQRVLAAMLAVPRHAFVPAEAAQQAYEDRPLGIGQGQTISQPFMVAAMSEALELRGTERVLEIGTGSGYQTAVLLHLAREVFTIEASTQLAGEARERFSRLGLCGPALHLRAGDGTLGWPARAPFDAILITAAAPVIPPPLLEQLAEEGILLLPAGSADAQQLLRVRRRQGNFSTERMFHCRFVPLLGRYGWGGEKS